MATSESLDLECPVCHEDLKEPKILPCTHLACKDCLLTWLTKVGAEGGCPMCRAPVINSAGDINSELDALPTNLVAVSLLESQQILQSPHLCSSCDSEASLFCMECRIKLCSDCFKFHKRFPATKSHTAEELGKLTAQQLAEKNHFNCTLHPDRTAELYCSAHKALICILCASTRHEVCSGKTMIDDVVVTTRQELRKRATILREKENQLNTKIQEVKEMFSLMRQTVQETFDALHKSLDKRQQDLQQEISKHEETAMTSVKALELSRIAVSSNAAIVEGLIEKASGAALLGMIGGLTTRMDSLDKQTLEKETVEKWRMEFNPGTLQNLQFQLASFGDVTKCQIIRKDLFESQICENIDDEEISISVLDQNTCDLLFDSYEQELAYEKEPDYEAEPVYEEEPQPEPLERDEQEPRAGVWARDF